MPVPLLLQNIKIMNVFLTNPNHISNHFNLQRSFQFKTCLVTKRTMAPRGRLFGMFWHASTWLSRSRSRALDSRPLYTGGGGGAVGMWRAAGCTVQGLVRNSLPLTRLWADRCVEAYIRTSSLQVFYLQ